jgi:hypothetical protein
VSDRDKTVAIMERLRRHYINPADDLPGGIFLEEVGRNGQHGRRADALYVGFTSASGRQLIGHEVKVSRADWRNELAKVGKADTWADDCHAWYVVAPEGVVPVDELPEGWGLLDDGGRTKTRLRTVVKATHYPQRTPAWDTVRSILARYDTLRARAIEAGRQQAYVDATKHAEAAAQRAGRGDPITYAQQQRLALLDRLEDALGWKVAEYSWGAEQETTVGVDELAAAIELVRSADKAPSLRLLDQTLHQLQQATEAITATRTGVHGLEAARSRR